MTRTAIVLALLCAGCQQPTPPTKATAKPSAAPSAVAAPAASGHVGVTPELERLIELSKTRLSPEEKHARLQQLLAKLPRGHSKEREALILGAVAQGALDPPEWTTITANYKGRRAEIKVTTDALTILGVRFDVTAEGAQRIADQLHAVLPTPRILQLIWEQADIRLDPCKLPADAQMASTARMIAHSECVDQRIAGRTGLVANEGKHWVLTNRIAGKENLAANYGWFVKGRRPVQTVGLHHDTAHTDYSQIIRLVKPIIRVDGREIDIRHVGRSPELWGLVSDEGPLFVWRASRPGAAPAPNDNPVSAAPQPAPGDPKSVGLTLEPKGMPVSLGQLPSSTTALRRNSFERRIQSALRMRPEDIPVEAYWSAGASACGGRDLFFEMMNGVPVDLKQLAEDRANIQKNLRCGQALTPHVKAGATVYEAEYAYESVPSGFALLSLADDALRESVSYPQLSPTPLGVHRAYCQDDEGGPRSVCQEGARSRLLLAVNGGYVAAYAREVPSLLARLTKSESPPEKLAELGSMFLEPTSAQEVAVAESGSCGFAVEFTYVELSPDETNRQRVLDAINDNAVLCGMQSGGSITKLERRYLFLAKNEVGAQVIQSALKRRAHEVRFEAGVAMPNRPDQAAFNKAVRSAAGRAARAAKFELDGRRLSVTLAMEPNAAEQRGMAGLLDARKAMAERAAAVVKGLLAGALPSAEQLAGVAGASTK